MNCYTLSEDEVLLYKGKAYRSTKGRKQVGVRLTNLYVVLIIEYDALIDQRETEVLTYPIEEIKVYKNKPQVNRKDAQVEIYAKGGEEYLEFLSKAEAKKFTDILWEEITNKTKFQRKIDKVKETVDYVDESFGIDTVQITKDTVKDGVVQKVLGGLKNMLPVKKKQDETVKKKKDTTKKNKKEQ